MPDLPLTGQCQCGSVKYQITRAPLVGYNCHCTNCQRITGAPFSSSLVIPADGFSITEGDPGRYEWASDVGSQRYGLFCKNCGTRLVHGMVPDTPMLSLRSGTLDDTSWLHPVGDIWTDSAQGWIRFDDGERLTYPRQPDDYSALAAAFAKLGLF